MSFLLLFVIKLHEETQEVKRLEGAVSAIKDLNLSIRYLEQQQQESQESTSNHKAQTPIPTPPTPRDDIISSNVVAIVEDDISNLITTR